MNTTTYYGIEINHYEANELEDEVYIFAVGGWIMEAATLEEAKEEIKGWVA